MGGPLGRAWDALMVNVPLWTGAPPHPWGIRSKTPSEYPKQQTVPNPLSTMIFL